MDFLLGFTQVGWYAWSIAVPAVITSGITGYGKPIDCHTDETDDPISRFTEVMAEGAMHEGMGRG